MSSSSSSDTDRDSISPPASEDEAQLQPRLRPHAHRPSFSSSSRSASLSSSTPPSSATGEHDEDSKARGSPGSNSSPSTSGSSPESRDALSHSIISSLDLESGSSSGRRTREPSIDAASSSGSSPRLSDDQKQTVDSTPESNMPSLPPLVREDSTTRRVMEDIDPSPPRSPTPPPSLSMLAHDEAESSGAAASRVSSSSYRAPSDFLGPMRSSSSSYGSSSDHDETTSGLPSTTTHDPEDQKDSAAPNAPKTTVAGDGEDASHLPETIPTVSATGMPRLLPRRTDDPQLDGHVGTSSRRDPPPPELLPEGADPPTRRRASRSSRSEGSYGSDEESDNDSTISDSWQTPFPPLILALIPSSNYAPTRRLSVITSTILIHLGIPILNGFFVGLGEIFARSLVAPLVLGAVERGRSLWRGWQLYGGVELNHWSRMGGLTRREKMEARVDAGDGEGVGMEGLGVKAV